MLAGDLVECLPAAFENYRTAAKAPPRRPNPPPGSAPDG